MKSPANFIRPCWRCRRGSWRGSIATACSIDAPRSLPERSRPEGRNRRVCGSNLRAFAGLLLLRAGVADENVEWLGSCTYCTPQTLGSFSRRTHFPAAKSFQYSWIMRAPAA
nr:Uncharacterised protein [Raoultella sp. NCTC 9187]